jgi:2-polyprenyl-3-methyl-5-hydroxy-6-metoxy-1,4-benzoquinol methylase
MTNQFADYVQDIQNRVRGCRVLDIGCLATAKRNILVRHKEYRKYTKEMIGIDYNKEFLEIVKLSGEKNIYHVDITNNTQVEKFIEQFGIFNHIIATDIIEHIGNLTLYLDNVYKLMSE